MKLLCIADLHDKSEKELIHLLQVVDIYDVVVLLGDIGDLTLELIAEKTPSDKPIIGILGNHDEFDSFEGLPIQNLNGKQIKIGGYTFAGIEGSFKYKASSFPSFTQEESIEFAESLAKGDVLLSHTSPYGFHEKDSNAHIGLKGINYYLSKNSPLWNLHGHQHVNNLTTLRNNSRVLGVYGVVILNIKTGVINKLVK